MGAIDPEGNKFDLAVAGWETEPSDRPAMTMEEWNAVHPNGAGATGTEAQIPGYTVAGKTGTAQVATPTGYSTTDYTASFVGMVPASHPRLVVLVKVDDPRGSIFGGVVAAPAFAAIAKFGLQYLEVPPDDPHSAARGGVSAG